MRVLKFLRFWGLVLVIGGLFPLTLCSCISQRKYQELKSKNEMQARIIHQSQKRIQELEAEVKKLRKNQSKN